MRRLVRNQVSRMTVRKESEVDEHALLRRIVDGDKLAFEAFYKHYYPRLFRFILRTTRQTDAVEELVQETLLLIWEKPERFNYESKISTWVFGIAYHKALKSMAKNARRSQDINVDELSETIGDPLANLAGNTEIQDWLDCALDQLSADQRAVIELTFHHGLTYQDIAKILECPENTVKTRMFHARKKLYAFAEAQEN
jgi:RNA polymerase sigma factor (sigma-70 family)